MSKAKETRIAELATPRDRNGSFEPQIVAKGQRRFEGFDQAIISLYSCGLTTREIEGYLLEIYGVEVSPGLVCSQKSRKPSPCALPGAKNGAPGSGAP